jgi:hypothetical protein
MSLKKQTVAIPHDGRVGFEGLGYFLAEVWKTSWSMKSRGEFSPHCVGDVLRRIISVAAF